MFKTLYVLDWDNYYNRTVHPELANYVNGGLGIYLENDLTRADGVNFNPNDGVNTEVTINIAESNIGDYLIVVNSEKQVESRWFIIDANRIRGEQYKLTLHRDVITDYWNIIKQSPALIEKASLTVNNPLIYNNEDMTFNQVKTREYLIKDQTTSAWLVGYLAKNATAEQLRGTVAYNAFENLGVIPAESWSEYEQYSSIVEDTATFYGNYKSIEYQVYFSGEEGRGCYNINGNDARSVEKQGTNNKGSSLIYNPLIQNYDKMALYIGFNPKLSTMKSLLPSYTPDRNSDSAVNEFLNFQGKLVQDTLGKVYRVSVVEVEASKEFQYDVAAGSLFNELTSAVNASVYIDYGSPISLFTGTPNDKTFKLKVTYTGYQLQLTEETSYETTYDMSNPTRIITEDAPYNIIAIPYGEIIVTGAAEDSVIATSADMGMRVITALQQEGTPLVVYDIQLVPFCPIPELIEETGVINVTDISQYSLIKTGDTPVGVIFNVPRANFSNITTFTTYQIDEASDAVSKKINNECDRWRLASPNYSNYFDFSVEKNGGVQYFEIDCCYKPYSPYIHIAPNFGGLYGKDFNDPRGLVCGGDFSLSQVKDAWQTYQLQNKNYQQTFDRQIQNMEINNKYQKTSEIVSAVAGTLQGGVSGASAGMFMSGGNPVMTGVGAAVGLATSAAAGITDVIINEKLRNEALDYTRDLFGYQLGNIQALPLTLTKVSAFNPNNKIFPVLEYYTATAVEKEALANKLAYNGMTVMTIGTVDTYYNNEPWEYTINNKIIKSRNYIKAKPIYLDLQDDFHIVNTIAKEMNMGFYVILEEE